MLTESDLRQIMPGIPQSKFEIYFLFLNRVMEDFEINTPLRAAAFLAQLAHESGQLRFMEEIWGPTAAQKRYEPPSDLARRLGNTQPGDGKRFKGRGPIQITGRANYQRYGDLLGVDLIRNPDLAATPQVAFQIAATFWTTNGLNELADAGNFTDITRRINGGLNGLEDRLRFYDIAKNVLGVVDQPADFPAANTRGGIPRGGGDSDDTSGSFADGPRDLQPLPPPELPSGYEEIKKDAQSTEPDASSAANSESKKKSAGATSKVDKKSVSKKSVKRKAKQASKKPAKKNAKKTAKKVAGKAVKTSAKKAAKKITKKVTKKPASKAAKKSAAKSLKRGAIKIIIVKAISKPAKKSR